LRRPCLSLAQLLSSLWSDHEISMTAPGHAITLRVIAYRTADVESTDKQIPLLRPEPLVPLPIESTHYVVALQNHPGERDALRNASSDTWERMTPIVHLVGPKTPRDALKAQTVRNWVKRLAGPLGAHPIYLDVTRLNPTHPVGTRAGKLAVLEYIYDASRACGLRFVPVTWVGQSSAAHRQLVADAALHDGHGIALRYRMRSYVPPFGTSIGDYLEAELSTVGHEAGDADLLIDLEYIDPDDEIDPEGIAASLREMVAVGQWRCVVVLGTSIPKMMGCVDEGTIGSLPRHEWELYRQLQQCDLDRLPAFGDYAIQNPDPPHMDGGPGRANIRYTTNGETLVARGRGPFYEEGKEQYRGLCQQLVARSEFAGRDYSWGDEVIDDCARGAVEPGAQNVWRGAGTSHHLRALTEQLASQR
jgi:Beta protein